MEDSMGDWDALDESSFSPECDGSFDEPVGEWSVEDGPTGFEAEGQFEVETGIEGSLEGGTAAIGGTAAAVSALAKIAGVSAQQLIRVGGVLAREGLKTGFAAAERVADWVSSDGKRKKRPGDAEQKPGERR